MAKQGYVNGSDLLMTIGEKACGHCTSHPPIPVKRKTVL